MRGQKVHPFLNMRTRHFNSETTQHFKYKMDNKVKKFKYKLQLLEFIN